MDISILKDYTGKNIPSKITDEGRRRGFIINWEHMAGNYGKGVDAQLLAEQILLCDETMEPLYEAPGPVRYVKGTRPVLEKAAKEITKGAKSETECAIMIMRYMRDTFNKCRGRQLFWGGTEEVLLEKGEQLCECVSRLEVALLEVLGIFARIITHTIGGHVTVEAFVDGKWGYVDPRCGMYFFLPDGHLASLWELLHDHSIMENQPAEVIADVSPRFPYDARIEALRMKYLSPLEVNTYKYYSLADADKYDYSWNTDFDCWRLNMNYWVGEYAEIRKIVMNQGNGRGTPTVRFSLPDGVTLSEDVMLAVRVSGVMVHPQIIKFYLDGEMIYESSPWVPISELSTSQHGVTYLGGANGSLPVSTLPDGEHKLDALIYMTPDMTVTKSLSFFVKH